MANTVERGLVNKSSLTAIGDAIRAKSGSTTKYKPSEMAAAISELKTGDFTVATSDKFNFKVVQSANQIIKSTPVGKTVSNSDGTVSLALTDDTTISPNTNYIPGTVQRSYDDSTNTYTVTATDAEPIDGLVQDGWSVVYQKTPEDNKFYPNADYTGTYMPSYQLQGNILIGGMKVFSVNMHTHNYPNNNKNILKFKNSFITSAGDYLLEDCSGLTYVELPNLTSAGDNFLWYCSSLTYIELPNLTSVDDFMLKNCSGFTSIELPNLTSVGNFMLEDMEGNSSSPINFIDFGYLTKTYNNRIYSYTRVMVLRADTVPTNFTKSLLSDPVLYIVPSALVDTYKSKVRSQDYVTALEKSPFADGKTVCGNNMKTAFGSIPDGDAGLNDFMLLWTDEKKKWELADKSSIQGYIDTGKFVDFFVFDSKLTREKGYIITK